MAEGHTTFGERLKLLGPEPNGPRIQRQENPGGTRRNHNEDGRTPRIQRREQTLGQWIVQIEERERQRMETSMERRTREWRQEIRDHRHSLKQDGRFLGIVHTIRRLQDGQEGREAIRRFWEDQYATEYADP
jgi:hypothetical protein